MVETVLFIGVHWARDMRVMDAWKRNGLTGGHHTHLSGLTKYNNYNAPSIGLNGWMDAFILNNEKNVICFCGKCPESTQASMLQYNFMDTLNITRSIL